MNWGFLFYFNSILLGFGLTMDAFSVSVANGLNEPEMRKRKMCIIAGTFGFFQALMPMLGWMCVHTIVEKFKMFERFIPWIALILLLYIGGKMVLESITGIEDEEGADEKMGVGTLFIQGIATSIDALSVGFTIVDYDAVKAFVCSIIIAAVTFAVCICGVVLGRTVGNRFSNKAEIVGGTILILIGIEIFVSGVFF